MKKLIPNCIIGFTTHSGDKVALFHVNSELQVNCALNRLTNGQLEDKFNGAVHWAATMFNRDPIYTGIWERNILSRGFAVDSHCVDPTKLNTGDLRRLCKKVVRKERKHQAK